MDVTLILTHRCNLACHYCYAGEHHGARMSAEMADRGVDLLFTDDSPSVQLSFFGGEPLIAFDLLQQAVYRAEERAAHEGRRLTLQCTTNGTLIDERVARFFRDHGFNVTVSIDGTREAAAFGDTRLSDEPAPVEGDIVGPEVKPDPPPPPPPPEPPPPPQRPEPPTEPPPDDEPIINGYMF